MPWEQRESFIDIYPRRSGNAWEVKQLFAWFRSLSEAEEAAKKQFQGTGAEVRIYNANGFITRRYSV